MISSFYEKIVGGSPPAGSNEPKILCVGIPCLDIVHVCKHFPIEDSDERCQEYRWQRGGNACNNCTVLSKLGSRTEFLGILGAARHNWAYLKEDMRKHDIDYSHCPVREGVECPMSSVILALNSASRTILHYNHNLPELELEDMERLDLESYSWIHFEGRNVPHVISMMQYVEAHNKGIRSRRKSDGEQDSQTGSPLKTTITVSVELEKKNVELLDLLAYADVAFISKDFAKGRGYANMSETLKGIGRDVKSGAVVVCAWGDRGAMAKTPDGTIVQSPAFSPPKIIDTLGAGDTFTAATLHYLNMVKLSRRNNSASQTADPKTMDQPSSSSPSSSSIEATNVPDTDLAIPTREIVQNPNIESLEFSQTEFIDRRVLQGAVTFACRVAGAKVGSRGYEGVTRAPEDLLSTCVAR